MHDIISWLTTPLGLIIIVAIIIHLIKKKNEDEDEDEDEDDRLSNKNATYDNIVSWLDDFEPIPEYKLKTGFTELSIKKQLYRHLKKQYKTVTMEHGVEGVHAKAIDIDVANGVAGIELKLSKALIKTRGFNSLQGQLLGYKKAKYKENLILMVFGPKDDKENTMMDEVNKFCYEYDIEFKYITIRELKQSDL